MDGATIGPARALRFDASATAGLGRRVRDELIVGARALEAITRALDADARVDLGRALGRPVGRRIAATLGGPSAMLGARVDAVAAALRAALAEAGYGAAELERRGRALLVAITRPAVSDGHVGAGFVAGALEAATARDLAGEPLACDRERLVILVARQTTARRARDLVAAKLGWRDVVARLHAGGIGA